MFFIKYSHHPLYFYKSLLPWKKLKLRKNSSKHSGLRTWRTTGLIRSMITNAKDFYS